jgi:hypothetical protein
MRLTLEWLNSPRDVHLRFRQVSALRKVTLGGGAFVRAWHVVVSGHRSRRVISEMS